MNWYTYKNINSGYIALISTIIISAVLIGLTSMVSQSSFFSRFDSLNGEYKRISKGMAESCINLALLEIAQNPNTPSVTDKQIGSVGCRYTITNPLSYISNKKIVNIAAAAEYPLENGAFSKIEANFTVYDPTSQPPSKIVVNVYSYGNGAKSPSEFGPLKVDGIIVQSGQATIFPTGTYNISETTDSDYITSFSGDCNTSGDLTLGANEYKTCNIINTIKPKTASLTVIISSSDGTIPAYLYFNSSTYSPLHSSQKINIPASNLNSNGTFKDFPITIAAIPGYNVSDWAGSVNDSGDSVCFGGYNDGMVEIKQGDNIVCAIAFSKQLPPADTVLMLDRTGSMDPNGSENYLPDEIDAANALVNILDDFMTKIGIGVFGATPNDSIYSATMRQSLTTVYSAVTSAISSGLSSASGYTNLQSAINVSQSAFPNDGNDRAIVLVSDGITNRPGCSGGDPCSTAENSATTAANTSKNAGTEIYAIHFGDSDGYDFLASLATDSDVNYGNTTEAIEVKPTSNGTDSGAGWSNPQNAYSIGGGLATDSGNHKHRYYNFTDSGNNPLSSRISSGTTIKGIEVLADASISGSGSSSTFFTETFGTGQDDYSIDNWDEEGEDNDSTTLARQGQSSGIDSVSSSGERFAKIFEHEWICREVNASGMNNLSLSYEWRGDSDSNNSNDDGIVEYKPGSGSCSDITDWQQLQNHDLQSDSSWTTQQSFNLPSSLNDTTFRLRFRNNNNGSNGNEYFRVDNVQVSRAVSGSSTTCLLGVDLSWNQGNSGTWTTQKTLLLPNTMATLPSFGGPTDTWGRNWQSIDFSSSRFRVRVQDVDPGIGCDTSAVANLDYLRLKVYIASSGVNIEDENNDGDHFFISPTSEDLVDIFKTVAQEISAPSVGQLAPILVVVTQVNNASGTASKTASDFDININNPTNHVFSDDGTGTIFDNLNVGSYAITPEDDTDGEYTHSMSPECVGTIAASQTKTCVVIYTSNPPPPPPIEIQQNIDVNSWHEVPISN